MERNEDVGAYLSVSNLQKACQTFRAQEVVLQGFGVQRVWRWGEKTGELKKALSDTDQNRTDLPLFISI